MLGLVIIWGKARLRQNLGHYIMEHFLLYQYSIQCYLDTWRSFVAADEDKPNELQIYFKHGEDVKYDIPMLQIFGTLTHDIVEKTVLAEELSNKSDADLRSGALDWTEEEETALRHKMDWRVVPWVTVLYLLCVSSAWDDSGLRGISIDG